MSEDICNSYHKGPIHLGYEEHIQINEEKDQQSTSKMDIRM